MFRIEEYCSHYNEVIMSVNASQITSLTIVYWTFYSAADQRKHQGSASLAFVRGIHWWPVNSPHKEPVTWKMFLFEYVIMVNCTNIFLVMEERSVADHNPELIWFYLTLLICFYLIAYCCWIQCCWIQYECPFCWESMSWKNFQIGEIQMLLILAWLLLILLKYDFYEKQFLP